MLNKHNLSLAIIYAGDSNAAIPGKQSGISFQISTDRAPAAWVSSGMDVSALVPCHSRGCPRALHSIQAVSRTDSSIK